MLPVVREDYGEVMYTLNKRKEGEGFPSFLVLVRLVPTRWLENWRRNCLSCGRKRCRLWDCHGVGETNGCGLCFFLPYVNVPTNSSLENLRNNYLSTNSNSHFTAFSVESKMIFLTTNFVSLYPKFYLPWGWKPDFLSFQWKQTVFLLSFLRLLAHRTLGRVKMPIASTHFPLYLFSEIVPNTSCCFLEPFDWNFTLFLDFVKREKWSFFDQ